MTTSAPSNTSDAQRGSQGLGRPARRWRILVLDDPKRYVASGPNVALSELFDLVHAHVAPIPESINAAISTHRFIDAVIVGDFVPVYAHLPYVIVRLPNLPIIAYADSQPVCDFLVEHGCHRSVVSGGPANIVLTELQALLSELCGAE